MDDRRFNVDGLARTIAGAGQTRRSLVPRLAGGALAALLGQSGQPAAAARCATPGKTCKTKKGKRPCCGGAKCRGTRCKCPAGRAQCGPKCCARGQKCQKRRCVAPSANPPPTGCTGDVCASGCPFTTLSAAVAVAPPGSTIKLCSGNYPVTELNLAQNLTLRGAGIGTTTVVGTGSSRVIHVAEAATVFLHDLTISGGRVGSGAGISNQGTLTLTNVVVTGNESQGDGGGINNIGGDIGGTLDLINSHVTLNKSGASQNGGGIYNRGGDVTLVNSSVTGNEAANGGGIYNQAGTVTLDGSSVTGNDAGSGAGINNTGTLTLTNGSQVAQNAATGFSGGGIANGTTGIVTIRGNSTVTDNETTASGGGIYNNGGSVTLNNGSVTLNRAIQGGGIATSGGTITTQNGGSITENTASTPNGAGGIYNDSLLGTFNLESDSVVSNTPNNCRPADSVSNCVG